MKIRAAVFKEIGASVLYAQILPLQVKEVDLDPPSRLKAKFEIADSGLRRPCIEEISARWRRNVHLRWPRITARRRLSRFPDIHPHCPNPAGAPSRSDKASEIALSFFATCSIFVSTASFSSKLRANPAITLLEKSRTATPTQNIPSLI